eukprot:scaffold163_cov162-Skeletonema_dohrnii-CCMP3373.AAC.2
MGEQNIVPTTVEGYTIPITYVNGLPHIKTTYPTNAEMGYWEKVTDLDIETHYLDEVLVEAGEHVVEIEDDGEDSEDTLQGVDEDNEHSQDELPSLVGQEPLNSDNRVVAIYLDPVGITFDVTEFNFVESELTLV